MCSYGCTHSKNAQLEDQGLHTYSTQVTRAHGTPDRVGIMSIAATLNQVHLPAWYGSQIRNYQFSPKGWLHNYILMKWHSKDHTHWIWIFIQYVVMLHNQNTMATGMLTSGTIQLWAKTSWAPIRGREGNLPLRRWPISLYMFYIITMMLSPELA